MINLFFYIMFIAFILPQLQAFHKNRRRFSEEKWTG